MSTIAESAQKLLFFFARRLAGYQCGFHYHFYKNNLPYDVSGLGLQLWATNKGGPTLNIQLPTDVEGSDNQVFFLLEESPEQAGLPLIGGRSASYYLWLSMQGEVGRILLAQTTVVIVPDPGSDQAPWSTGAQKPEDFRIDLDDTTGNISGSIGLIDPDYGILYNAIANLGNATWPQKTVDSWALLLDEPLPSKNTLYIVTGVGLFVLFKNGRIEDPTGNVFRNATI